MGKMASEAFFVVVVVVAAAAAVVLANALPVRSERGGVEKDEVNIWPMPAWVSHGRGHLYMSNDFVLSTEGSGYGDASGILKDAFHRMLAVIKLDHVVDANFSALHDQPLLQGLRIVISSPKDQLQYGIDESYKLMVPSPEKPAYAHLVAPTVYGALHGLQGH
ncbi:Beta-hexosaminidase [Theobroma cacao]|nr:Beta-hexosaminidase [Theobroma cacao]